MIIMDNNNLTFVQAILKRFGIFVYIGNQIDEIVLMELEIQELYEWKMITDEEYIKALGILKRVYNSLSDEKGK